MTSLAYNVSPDGGLDPLAAIQGRFDVPVLIENNVNLGRARGVVEGAGAWRLDVRVRRDRRGRRHGAGRRRRVRPWRARRRRRDRLPAEQHRPYDERHRLHGGLEDEIGAAGILAAFRAISRELDQPRTHHTARDAHEVFELALGGDPDAQAVIENVARRLGAAIASVIAVIDPELVVLGGGIGRNPALLAPVRATVAQLVPLTARIETSTLGDRAALHGAVALALRDARAQLFTRAAR